MNSEEGVETIEKKFKSHSCRSTQELSGITPRSIREQAKVENKNPGQIIEASLRLGGMINVDEQIETIGPGGIKENGKIILLSETEIAEGEIGTMLRRGTVIEMTDVPQPQKGITSGLQHMFKRLRGETATQEEGVPQQDKTFKLRQPSQVPVRKGHAVLIHNVTEPISLEDLRSQFQKNKVLVLKIIPSETKR